MQTLFAFHKPCLQEKGERVEECAAEVCAAEESAAEECAAEGATEVATAAEKPTADKEASALKSDEHDLPPVPEWFTRHAKGDISGFSWADAEPNHYVISYASEMEARLTTRLACLQNEDKGALLNMCNTAEPCLGLPYQLAGTSLRSVDQKKIFPSKQELQGKARPILTLDERYFDRAAGTSQLSEELAAVAPWNFEEGMADVRKFGMKNATMFDQSTLQYESVPAWIVLSETSLTYNAGGTGISGQDNHYTILKLWKFDEGSLPYDSTLEHPARWYFHDGLKNRGHWVPVSEELLSSKKYIVHHVVWMPLSEFMAMFIEAPSETALTDRVFLQWGLLDRRVATCSNDVFVAGMCSFDWVQKYFMHGFAGVQQYVVDDSQLILQNSAAILFNIQTTMMQMGSQMHNRNTLQAFLTSAWETFEGGDFGNRGYANAAEVLSGFMQMLCGNWQNGFGFKTKSQKVDRLLRQADWAYTSQHECNLETAYAFQLVLDTLAGFVVSFHGECSDCPQLEQMLIALDVFLEQTLQGNVCTSCLPFPRALQLQLPPTCIVPCISLVSHLYRALYLTCISPVSHLYLTCISPALCLDPTCIVPCISLVSHLYRALYLTCISPVSHLYLTCISPALCLDPTCIVPCISLVSRALYLTCISPVSCPVSHLYLTCISLVSCPVSHLYLTCIVP